METSFALDCFQQTGFASTRWTVIRACAGDDQASQLARDQICRNYWYPVYAYIKRVEAPGDAPEDLAQDFFAHILSRPWFDRADQSKGKFRSFLLTSLRRFLQDRADAEKALKRGGNYRHVPLTAGEDPGVGDPFADSASAAAYDAEWAAVIVASTLRRLEQQYVSTGRDMLYRQLKVYLTREGDAGSYGAVSGALGISAGNVKVGVHRLRKEYGAILREEVARTVASPQDIDGEMRHLRTVLAAG